MVIKKNIFRRKMYIFLLLLLAVTGFRYSPLEAYAAPLKKNVTVKLTVKGSVKTVTVDPGTVIRIKVRQGKKRILPSKLKFTSSKKKVAKVDTAGIVTTKKEGTVRIRVRRIGKKTKATLKVIVKKRVYTAEAESTEPEIIEGNFEHSARQVLAAGYLGSGYFNTGQIPHVHKWNPVVFSDPEAPEYPAERCSVCGLERWTDTGSGESAPGGKFIMIGDSYGARSSSWGGNYTWPYQVAKGLGLSEGQAYISCKGGYGFAVSGSFTNLLRFIDPDPQVKYVVVVGGIGNDQYQSKEAIQTGCKVFALEVKTRFPKAKVIYAAPNTHVSNESWLERLAEHRPWYEEACEENGWTYLKGCETILAGQTSLFRADGHHPNEEGEVVLGAALTKKLRAVL